MEERNEREGARAPPVNRDQNRETERLEEKEMVCASMRATRLQTVG